jgi:hypothetical protein
MALEQRQHAVIDEIGGRDRCDLHPDFRTIDKLRDRLPIRARQHVDDARRADATVHVDRQPSLVNSSVTVEPIPLHRHRLRWQKLAVSG